MNPASGEPVPVGMISTGKTDAIDNQIEIDVAQATVKWWNERKGGIGGRPIELVTCVVALGAFGLQAGRGRGWAGREAGRDECHRAVRECHRLDQLRPHGDSGQHAGSDRG